MRGLRGLGWAAGLATLALLAAAQAEPRAPATAAIAADPLPPQVLSADGPPSLLLGQEQRRQIGIKNGPDSIADLWSAPGGSYLVFSGALQSGVRGTFRVPVDPTLSRVTAAAARDVEVVMAPRCGTARDARARGDCQDFDSNYAGGGTVFPCPDGTFLYFYHGENHTDPQGVLHHGPQEGWTGIGVAVWDPGARRFVRPQQVVGLNASNLWQPRGGRAATLQGPPISGNPSAVRDPSGRFVYLYYTDRTEDPAYAGGALACDRRPCTAVARAEVAQACGGGPSAWRKYYRGDFTEPAVFQSAPSPELPRGTGGRFTPLYPRADKTGENVPNVTYIASRHLYVMVALRQPGGGVVARYSADGLRWSEPGAVVAQAEAAGQRRLYPRLQIVAGPGGGEAYVLTYVDKSEGSWSFGELVRQPLHFAGR